MRPIIIAVGLWMMCCCALAQPQTFNSQPNRQAAQTNAAEPAGSRHSRMRDSGVITRVSPPSALEADRGSGDEREPPFNPSSPTTAQAPNSAASAALSDRAWVQTPVNQPESQHSSGQPSAGQPSAGQASARQAPPSTPMNSGAYLSAPPNSQVVPAQFVTSNTDPGSPNIAGGANLAGSGREPRPLKPPSSADSKSVGKGTTGTVQMFISVLSSLAIVIGLIFAAAWFYRKAAPKMSGALPKQVVQVLGRTPLAPRQQLVLLRLGSKLVLVSNLHGEVRTISEITDPLEVDRLAGLCESAQPGSISESFRSVLHSMGRSE